MFYNIKRVLFYSCILLHFNAYTAELKIITPESFLLENPSSERVKIVDEITHQFNGKSVTKKELDFLWNNIETREIYHLSRFQIIDQKLYAATYNITNLYFLKMLDYLNNLFKNYKIQNIDFILHTMDEVNIYSEIDKKNLSIPIFMMSKDLNSPYEKNKLLLPDAHILKNNWAQLLDTINKANLENPWDKKLNKIFWRGQSTGSTFIFPYNITNIDKLARLKLVMLSKLYPDLIDAKITKYAEFSDDEDGKNLQIILDILFGENNSPVKEKDHLIYKYLIAIDGTTCPWVRVPWIMASNSVLLKQETDKVQWFYSALQPYLNYVPINEDLTDIFEKVDWIKNNDKEVKQISLNAQHFIKNELMPEHVDKHMVIILNEYHKIQKDKNIVATLPPYEQYSSSLFFAKELFSLFQIRIKALIRGRHVNCVS